MPNPSHDQFPIVAVLDAAHACIIGWDKIAAQLQAALTKTRATKPILVVECYPGVDELTVMSELHTQLAPKLAIRAAESYHSPEKIDKLIARYLAGAGHVCDLSLVCLFDAEPLWRFRRTIDELKDGLVLIVGCGASLIAWGNILVHADLVRREAQTRLQENGAVNLGANNQSLDTDSKLKRARLVDWPVADRWKKPLIKRWDYVLAPGNPEEPKLARAENIHRGLEAAIKQPLRLVPPNDSSDSLAAHGLLLGLGESQLELPAIDLLFSQPRALLGEAVHARFGTKFPLRFDLKKHLTNPFEPLIRGDGWRQERMRAREEGIIEIRRHWFTKTAPHHTHGGVNILSLFQGEKAIIESPTGAFEPLVIRNGETIVVPAAVGRYKISPPGATASQELGTIRAFVRA